MGRLKAGFKGLSILIALTLLFAQAKAEEPDKLKEVFPQGERFEEIKKGKEVIYYKAFDKEGRLIGAVFKSYAKGYSGPIQTLAGMLKDGTLVAVKVLSQNETPGLGARVAEKQFSAQFANKKFSSGFETISGATVSSDAVINSLKDQAQKIQGLLRDER